MQDLNIEKGKIYQNVYERKYDQSKRSGEFTPPKAVIENGRLLFEKDSDKDKAFREGCFLLKIPDSIQINLLDAANREVFNIDSEYRKVSGSSLGDCLLGFHSRKNQIEQFLMESRFWDKYFNDEILGSLINYRGMSSLLIREALLYAGIPGQFYNIGTGGCVEEKGTYHITFNHYRSNVNSVGLEAHKDDGFITILRTNSDGLEINRHDCWEKVKVQADYFIINFGLTMEILTKKAKKPLHSILHRVARQDESRFSYGFFASSKCYDEDAGIYTYENNSIKRLCDSRSLIDLNDYEIYEGTKKPR